MKSYREIAEEVKIVARDTGRYIHLESLKFNKEQVQSKGLNDFVSHVDLQAEKQIVERLNKILPEAGFIAEEGSGSKKSDLFNWVVDPLDGTTNFLHALPPYSISIALTKSDKIVVGIVYVVTSDEMFWAASGEGSWLNDKRIYVSTTPKLSDSLVGTGFPYKDFDRLTPYLRTLDHLIRNTHGVRRQGSAAVDLAYVACGRLDCFFEYNLNPWDVTAGILLIREAGGIVTDFDASEKNLTGSEIVASNRMVFEEFRSVIIGNIR